MQLFDHRVSLLCFTNLRLWNADYFCIEFSKLADTILGGNMKELRNQVIVHFPNINRKYKDHHLENRFNSRLWLIELFKYLNIIVTSHQLASYGVPRRLLSNASVYGRSSQPQRIWQGRNWLYCQKCSQSYPAVPVLHTAYCYCKQQIEYV